MNYIIKDITLIKQPAIIMHGVNCQGVMASGVAKAIYEKWPKVKEEYMKYPKEQIYLGKIDPVRIEENLYVVNCWTQDNFGYDHKVYANIFAIKECLESVIKFARKVNLPSIYSPPIGCGLGGLNWENDVEPIFTEVEIRHREVNITICNFK